jgi:hypothetical protein
MKVILRLIHTSLTALSLSLLLPLAVFAHNVYTTFTTIEWNGADKSIELVLQLHAHELEAHLSLDLGERLTFLNEEDFPKLENAVGPLAKRMIALELDGSFTELTYLGMEMQGQTVFIYMETDWPTPPSTIKFMNALFLDELPGQNNSVMAKVDGVRKAGEIQSGTGPVTLQFN